MLFPSLKDNKMFAHQAFRDVFLPFLCWPNPLPTLAKVGFFPFVYRS